MKPAELSIWPSDLEPLTGAASVRVLVLAGQGLNCESETAYACTTLGASADIFNVQDFLQSPGKFLASTDFMIVPGGFSYGDHLGSGKVLAERLREGAGQELLRFVADGGLVLGICNGFQTLVKMGLLPGTKKHAGPQLAEPQASLAPNDRLGYRNARIRLKMNQASPCIFTRGASGVLDLPSRHGEGKLVFTEEAKRLVLEHNLIPLHYVDAHDNLTEAFPENPSGSPQGAAGLCDLSGRVFGLMPHPEGYTYPEQHPAWRRQVASHQLPRRGLGLGIFWNAIEYLLRR